ncbi:MAG TPA: HD domain-containing protein [Rubrobacteraceae bacterium]|nr:HD domain-containing protein [Rubrobacteraceae bacterium]
MRATEALTKALVPPADLDTLLELVPELTLSRELRQGPFHHLDTLAHTLEVVRGVERELDENRIGARVAEEYLEGLRLAALLHDVAKPVTRGDFEGRVIFVAHDSLGARMIHGICTRLDLSAPVTDAAATLTSLHLKIGFMANSRSDYPPDRLVRAAGPFGEALAVLSWADRLAAQGPRLKDEHVERHRDLCGDFLHASRRAGPHPAPDYEEISRGLKLSSGADVGYAASRARLLASRGMDETAAFEHAHLG